MRTAPALTLAGIRRSHGAIMHLRIMLAPLLLAFAVLPPKTYAVSPAAKLFGITGSPPMQAIAVNTLSPSNSKHTKFSGGAQLQLADSSALALVTKLVIGNAKGLYAFKSVGSGLPKFKGKITTSGEPESVNAVALTLRSGTSNKVKDTTSASVTVAPSPTPSTSPFIGEFTGTFALSGAKQRLTGPTTIVIGTNGMTGEWFLVNNAFGGASSGVANLMTGAVTVTQLSTQLSGHITASVQLEVNGSLVTGSGKLIVSNNKTGRKHSSSSGIITITGRANVASNYVGVYLGTLNITNGPDSPNRWPIALGVANDGTAGGQTFDPQGNGFSFQGTVNLSSGAFTLPVTGGHFSLTGITGNLMGNFVTPSLANGSFNLSNGDTGTVSFPKVAP